MHKNIGKVMPTLSKFCYESLRGDTDWRCCVQMS